MLGLGSGGNPNIIAYLISRYFGTRSYGELYGSIYGIHIIGSGLSPLVLGLGYDAMGSYTGVLVAYAGLIIAAAGHIVVVTGLPGLDKEAG